MRRGQAGLEYTAIIVLALLALVPAALYLYQNAANSSNYSHAELAAIKIAAAADAVKAQSPGAKVTVEIYVPKGVNASYVGGREVVFGMTTSEGKPSSIYRVTVANLTQSTLPSSEGAHTLEISHLPDGNVSISATP